MTAFDKAWNLFKNDVHATKNRCDLCGAGVPSGTGAHIETIEGGDFHWVCNECGELYASDDDAFQGKAEQARREGHIDSTDGPVDLEDAFDMFIMDSGHNAMTMEDAVQAVRMFVEADNEVMPSVQLVANRLGIKGKELMRAYVEAYR